mgnify:CR=1 FL=1
MPSERQIEEKWTTSRKAIFKAVIDAALNSGKYVNAYELTDKIQEALTASQAEGWQPKVKALEWVPGDGVTADEEYYEASPIPGVLYWVIEGQCGLRSDPNMNPDATFFDDDNQAKAFCQADYERRILSALDMEESN